MTTDPTAAASVLPPLEPGQAFASKRIPSEQLRLKTYMVHVVDDEVRGLIAKALLEAGHNVEQAEFDVVWECRAVARTRG